MRRYKMWLVAISLPIFALTLAACGSSNNNNSATDTPSSAGAFPTLAPNEGGTSPTNTPNAAESGPTSTPNAAGAPMNTPEANAPQPSNPAGGTTITIVNGAFQPQDISVAAGATVTWTNQDSAAHTVTSGTADAPTNLFDSGDIAAGGSFSFTFTDPGTYEYYSTSDSGMTGTVTVTSAG
jgi:plastocyanin